MRPSPTRLSVLVGEQLKTYRLRAHLTLPDTADRAEISNRFLREIERGTAVVTVQTIERIADVIDWDIGGLIRGGSK